MPDIFSPEVRSSNLKIVSGQHTTVAASDTVVTGLTKILYAVAVLESDPVAGCADAQAVVGDQAGTPAKGSILIKTWKRTADGANAGVHDTTPTAATTFSKKVNYIALGY